MLTHIELNQTDAFTMVLERATNKLAFHLDMKEKQSNGIFIRERAKLSDVKLTAASVGDRDKNQCSLTSKMKTH